MRVGLPVIVLAGGRGSRLRSVVSDVPKPLAPVGGRPFLDWLIMDILAQGAQRVLLSVGYMGEAIVDFVRRRAYAARVECRVEASPLGTGGAIRSVMAGEGLARALVLNGDSLFAVRLADLQQRLESSAADVVLAVRRVDDVSRYGAIVADANGRVVAYREKGSAAPGLINGGVYALDFRAFAGIGDGPFSFEEDVLARGSGRLSMIAVESAGYFVDIGIPGDYERACREVPRLPQFEDRVGHGH